MTIGSKLFTGNPSLAGGAVKVPKAFAGKTIAFRPADHDGVFNLFFRSQWLATVDICTLDRNPKSVHDVSEHVFTLSPV